MTISRGLSRGSHPTVRSTRADTARGSGSIRGGGSIRGIGSIRGSGSISGRGNEAADEWNPNTLGYDGLEDQELTDDEEHVTGSSQDQVGSNVTPSSSLPKLWLVGGTFNSTAIGRYAVKLFKSQFKGGYTTWSQVPQRHRDKCFNRFRAFYRWDAAIDTMVRVAWDNHISNRYRDIMRSVRKAAKKKARIANDNQDFELIIPHRPIWISESDWLPMIGGWDTDEWRAKSKAAAENRANSESGKHTAGSKSFLHTKMELKQERGRPVKLLELHTHVHAEKGTRLGDSGSTGNPEFIDPIAQEQSVEYTRILREKHAENDENGGESPPDDFDVWKSIAKSKRGGVLGAGASLDPAFVLTGTIGSESTHNSYATSHDEEIRLLKEQNANLKKLVEEDRAAAKAQREIDVEVMQKLVNDKLADFIKNFQPNQATDPDPN